MENEKILSRDEVFLKKITEAVLNNLGNEQFGVTELSEAVAISRFQLHRKLKVLQGKSVSQFIREVRLEEAMKMLRADAATASEIAYRVGFGSPSYFNKCFSDYYGYSPGEVKKRNIDLVDDNTQETSVEEVYIHSISEPLQKQKSLNRKTLKTVLLIITPIVLIAVAAFYFLPSKKKDQVSIAILPLDNLTGYEDQTYFVNGMHDALVGELGQVSALRVISRTSTLRYPKSEMLLQDIARELGVDIIVEGSVYGSGDSVRIQLQLIEAFPKERHLWAKEYHENIRNALAMHSSVVRDIAKEIQVTLSPEEEKRLRNTRIVNPETYRAYLRGMFNINQPTPEAVETGISQLHEALRADPDDPLLWAALSIGYGTLNHGPTPAPGAVAKAKAAAHRALELDSTLAEAHLALAMFALYTDWDWNAAEKGFSRALQINPNLAEAHTHYAWFKMLFGQMDEVLMHGKTAIDLDPFSSLYSSYLGCEYCWAGKYDLGFEELENTLAMAPDNGLALYCQGSAYSLMGMDNEAIASHKNATNAGPQWRWTLAHTYAVANREKEEVQKIIEELEADPKPIDTWGLAEVYAALGKKDEAFEWLEEGYKVRFSWIPWIAWNPNYKSLHNDPRFDDLLKKMNLPPVRQAVSQR